MVWLTDERHLTYFLPGPLSEILTIANLWDTASRIWTCIKSEFRFSWMGLCSSNNQWTTAPLPGEYLWGTLIDFSPFSWIISSFHQALQNCRLKTPCLFWKKFMKNQYRGRDCLKRGAWTVCRFKGGGGLGKKDGVVFLREGWYPNAHYGPKLSDSSPQMR